MIPQETEDGKKEQEQVPLRSRRQGEGLQATRLAGISDEQSVESDLCRLIDNTQGIGA